MRIFPKRTMAALATAAIALFSPQPGSADLVTSDYSRAEPAGKVSCPSKFGETETLGAAFLHIWNNTCWSCPKDYARTVNPDVAGGGACQSGPFKKYAVATRHGRATGLIGTDCPAGSGQFWHIGDGHCYSCPAGYGRTVFGIDSARACETTIPAKFAAGVRRGAPGCPEGAFQHFLSDSCYRCPDGYARSLTPSLDGKLETLDTACVRVPPPGPAGALAEVNRNEVARVEERYAGLIATAARVAWNLKDHTAEIEAATREGRPLSPQLRESSGLNALAEQADKEGFETLTIGVALDISLLMGGTVSAGLAHGVQDWTGVYSYSSNAWSICCSVGGDVAPEIGLWQAPPQRIAGDAHGVTAGASKGFGAAVSFWWDYCPDVEGKICVFHPFLGFSVLPQAGVSVELEYVRGTTRASMIQVGR